MKQHLSKDYIINYLKDYYINNKSVPKSRDKSHPFSDKTVYNKFGGWNKALIEADIPLNVNEPKEVICNQCNKLFTKLYNQIKKSNHHFCSKSCCAKYNNKIIDRTLSEISKNKIREKLQKIHKCVVCESIIKGGQRKTCSDECKKKVNINNGKIGGLKGGRASVASQQRRSKNEIFFSNLCIQYFGKDDILCNEQIFKDINGNFWDCDIYIKSLKIAILWDGFFWHYSPNATDKQKARDILKRKIILNNNSTYYTIIDKGKYNEKFVKEQFYLFLHKQQFKTTLDRIIRLK